MVRMNSADLLMPSRQLAVCHGLVIARMQSRASSNDVLPRLCSPVSFGILTREPYDPQRHRGDEVRQDPFDKKLWAEGQINWVLKRVSLVTRDIHAEG